MKEITVLFSILILFTSMNAVGQSFNEKININQAFFLENTLHLSLYRIRPSLTPGDLPKNAEIAGGQPGLYTDVIMDEKTKIILEKKGYHIEIIESEITNLSQTTVNQYHTYDEIVEILESISSENPEIIELFSIGKSYENRDIWCLEISDNPGIDEDEPEILFMGLHHAREWPTIEICLTLADHLINQYKVNTEIHDLIDNRRIWIIPCVNPDGYVYDHDIYQGSQWWRKNRHYLEQYDLYGIDLNRNYGGSTNGDPSGMWGSLGMSHHPKSDLYCGSNPFSELETQAIQQFYLSHDICAAISWHTSGELVMWPWGYTESVQTPHYEYISQVGIEISSRIIKQKGNGTYTPTQAAGLYPTSGDTIDWMYGYSHYVKGKPCFAYTIEACETFHPDQNDLEQICNENVDGALYLLTESAIINTLQPSVLPPVILDINENDNKTYTMIWDIYNPLSDPIKFEIREYYNMRINKDFAEEQHHDFLIDGFTQNHNRAYSGSSSYYAHNENNKVSTITSINPLFINQSMDLSFFCWYEIEEDYDKAFVEISTDGRNYTIIDMFTGLSKGWIFREYSLDAFIGKSVFIRFRYITDDLTLKEGFYIDDIYPVTSYETITSLNDNITKNSYLISTKPNNRYYYQIRGYNELEGWGDYSMLKPIKEIAIDNSPPIKPSIIGPQRGKIGESFSYEINSIDPEDHQIYYFISWGDGEIEEWIGPFNSGEKQTIEHTWQENGEFTVELRAKDIFDSKSDWTIYQVTLQKYKEFLTIWYQIVSYLSLT